MKKHFTLICLLCLFLNSGAQPYLDIVNSQFYVTVPAEFFAKKDTQTDARYSNLALAIPLKFRNSDMLVISPAFRKVYFSGYLNADYGWNDLLLPITYVKQWKDSAWKTSVTFIPRIASDFEKISGNDYQAGGAVVMNYQRNQKIKYRFGLYYNKEFFGNYFLPLAGIDWRVNKKLNIFGLLPNDLTMEWKPLKYLHAGVAAKSTFHSYRINDEVGDFYLRISEAQTLLFADWYITQKIAFNVSAGAVIVRGYAIEKCRNSESEFTIDDAFVIGAGLAYRVRLDE